MKEWAQGAGPAGLARLSSQTMTVQEKAVAAATLRGQLTDRAKLLNSVRQRAAQLVKGELNRY